MTLTAIRNRGLALTTLVLAIAVASSFAVSARAGEWVQRSCSYGTEYIAPEGWEGKENYGYDKMPYDNCERFPNGGGLETLASGFDGTQPLSGQTWRYKAPSYATIAGGVLAVTMTARHGGAIVAAEVKEQPVSLASCESPGCHSLDRMVPITAVGATELHETAFCFPNGEGVCPAESFNTSEANGVFAAEATISSAQIILSTSVTPTGSGFTGTLLNNTVTGKGTLSFTAKDPGPGVYQTRVKIDGEQVWVATPNLNEGKCVSTGTTEGIRAFNYAQPCPAETAVHAEIDTSGLADGAHALTVEVEDAAGDTTAVYASTLTTLNHPVPTIPPPNRGATNGTPASDNATLTASPRDARTYTRGLSHSALTLTGRLTDPSHTPITGAQIQLLQQPTSASPPTQIATTTTRADGTWTIKVPKGPSRLLRVAYFSHMLDTTPAATLDFHERVPAVVLMHAPHTTRLGHAVVFSGQLAGGYVPPGGESVQMEIFYSGRWRTIEVLPTNSRGRWAYKYVFTLGAGASYRFRAVTVPNGVYPFMSAASKPVSVTVQR